VKRGIPVFLIACTVGLAQQYVAWTVAGGGQPFTPVEAVNASIASGGSLAADAGWNIYIRSSQCVLKVDPHGILTLVAGNGRAGSPLDGVPATSAHLSAGGPIASDPAGNIYTTDPSIRVRKIPVNGTITTVAGNGTQGSSGDGGPATSAQFNEIESLAADGAGNFYVADSSAGHRVRRVSASGIISTVAGNGTAGFSGDGGPATSAQLNDVEGVAVDGKPLSASQQVRVYHGFGDSRLDFPGRIHQVMFDGKAASVTWYGREEASAIIDAALDLAVIITRQVEAATTIAGS